MDNPSQPNGLVDALRRAYVEDIYKVTAKVPKWGFESDLLVGSLHRYAEDLLTPNKISKENAEHNFRRSNHRLSSKYRHEEATKLKREIEMIASVHLTDLAMHQGKTLGHPTPMPVNVDELIIKFGALGTPTSKLG